MRLLILQSVFSVGGVLPQLPSRFRNAICHASGMQAKEVWLVHKHPSRFRNAIKSSCLQNYASLSFPVLWRSHCPKTVMRARKKELGD